jgi:formylglycine-generating enzyme required for sulfatase activity
MGSPESETDRDPIEPQHEVTIDRSFAISSCEVTIEQFLRFQPAAAHSPIIGPDVRCPVNRINWLDAVRYCRWLSELELVPESEMCYPEMSEISPTLTLPADFLRRTGYRLPTEAEWECACRGGTQSRWFFGDDDSRLAEHAWYLGNSQERTWPVGTSRPNPIGLFDVYGNVAEWCHDVYGPGVPGFVEPTSADGVDVLPGERMFRGGSYRSMTRLVRTAKRYSYPPTAVYSILGFRLARTMPTQAD